jgi:predicted DNA-binding WGR domain protein
MIMLHRIEPARNMRQYYTVEVEQDLFGAFGVVRTWGRIGRRGQQLRQWFRSREEALRARKALLRSKLRRGYELVGKRRR